MQEAVEKVKTYWTHKTLGFDFEEVLSYDLTVPNIFVTRENKQVKITFSKVDDVLGYALYAFPEGEDKDYNNSNVVQIVRNDKQAYEVNLELPAYRDYTFGIKIIYKDGELSEDYKEVFAEKNSFNEAPQISNVRFNINRKYFQYAEKVNILGNVMDANEDNVNVSVLVSTNGTTYSYNFDATVTNNQFSYAWRVPSLKTSSAKIKIIASDGLLESEYIINDIVIRDYVSDAVIVLDKIQINYDKILKEMLR